MEASREFGLSDTCRGIRFGNPELGFDAAEAALGPLGGDEGVDERELGGAGGVVVVVKSNVESFEPGGIFAGDDVGAGIDAGFEGVEGGSALPSVDVGPVDFRVLRRLALIWASVDMVESQFRATTGASVFGGGWERM